MGEEDRVTMLSRRGIRSVFGRSLLYPGYGLFFGTFFQVDFVSAFGVKKDPMADRSGQTSKFWDGIADNYSKQPIADEAAYQKKIEITQQYLRPDMEVLEIGCGTGGTAITHAPLVRNIVAIDISSKMISIATKRAEDKNVENVTFEQSTIDGLQIPDESKDVVLGLSILHLLKNKEEAIAQVHKMLKPGGLFISSTTCVGDMGARYFIQVLMPVGRFLGFMPMVNVFSKQQLKHSLMNSGFTIEYEWQPAKEKAVFLVGRKS